MNDQLADKVDIDNAKAFSQIYSVFSGRNFLMLNLIMGSILIHLNQETFLNLIA